MEHIVGIGDIAIANRPHDVIKTYALASCVAVTAYCPITRTAGMVHIALPDSTKYSLYNPEHPCYYANIAVPMLIQKMCMEYGCRKENLQIELFGGAGSARKNDYFQIGARNVQMVTMILNSSGIRFQAVEIGGENSRTLEFTVATGQKKVYLQPLII